MAVSELPEEWRDVAGYEGLYQVSSYGRIKSLAKVVPHSRGGRSSHRVERILKPDTSRLYLTVCLHRQGDGGRTKRIAALVCEAFHGPKPSPIHQVAHGNGKHRDNREGNLRWATPKENGADQIALRATAHGARQHRARLTDEAVRQVRRRYADGVETLEQIGKSFGVTKNCIHAVVMGRTWKHVEAAHGGF